ncbi:MAG TPA: hypothetical protein P5165_12135 [Spirochaetia bacterium]|nr:hypothetical protein [Spirochaetales bacterium]HRY73965.1 hypothetical protein [Spirochaetia bacterium]
MKHRMLVLAAVAALAAASLAFAAPPAQAKAVPVYPGAAADPAAADYAKELSNGEGDPDLVSEEVIAYATAAAPEEVFAWYRQKLAAKPMRDITQAEYESGSTPPMYYLEPYEEEDFRDGTTGDRKVVVKYEGAWIREQLKAKRKPLEGAYLSSGSFSWMLREKDGRARGIVVTVLDASFLPYIGEGPGAGPATLGKKNYAQKTYVFVYSQLRKSEGEAGAEREERRDAEGEADMEAARAYFAANPPSAKELGLPLYPGAAFDAENSAGMSMDEGMKAWLFTTADSLDKVVAFYEKASGRKAERLGQARRIVLKGSGLMPEHFLALEPGAAGGTAISFFKTEE